MCKTLVRFMCFCLQCLPIASEVKTAGSQNETLAHPILSTASASASCDVRQFYKQASSTIICADDDLLRNKDSRLTQRRLLADRGAWADLVTQLQQRVSLLAEDDPVLRVLDSQRKMRMIQLTANALNELNQEMSQRMRDDTLRRTAPLHTLTASQSQAIDFDKILVRCPLVPSIYSFSVFQNRNSAFSLIFTSADCFERRIKFAFSKFNWLETVVKFYQFF